MIKLENPILEASINQIIEKLEKQGIIFNKKVLIEIAIFYVCNMIQLDNNVEQLQNLEIEYNNFMSGYNV